MKYAVYAQYDIENYDRGEIISTHKTYDAAEKGLKKAGAHESFLAIAEVDDDVQRGENINWRN